MTAQFHLNMCFLDKPLNIDDIFLHQIGKMYCEPGQIIDEHYHSNWFELTIAIDGKGYVYTNKDNGTLIQKGDIYFSFHHELHKLESDTDSPLKFLFISFSTQNDVIFGELSKICISHKDSSKRVFNDDNISKLVNLLISNFTNSKTAITDVLNQSLLKTIILLTINSFSEKSPKIITCDADEVLAQQVMNYIDSHLLTIKSLKDVSENMHYNYSYLSNKFKKITNTTILDYYNIQRFNYACAMLRENYSISKVSEILNFSSLYAFSKAFKKYYGSSPRSFVSNLTKKD